MKTINIRQGSPEWLEFRKKHFTASEACSMMGESKYQTRDELLNIKKTGITPEIDANTQRIFDNGHKYEALARPFAEQIIGEELYPATGFDEVIEGLELSASFDGVTMLEDVIWEHKSINDVLRQIIPDESQPLPLMYRIQMEQQLMISGAEKCLFMASDGTKENCLWRWYESDPVLADQIIKGWIQFEEDLENFTPAAKHEEPKGKTIEALPALIVNVSGQVATTNIDAFEIQAREFIESINTDLQTDQQFADAEQMVKFCDQAEKQIKSVKQQSVESMADVSKVFRTMDAIAEELRQKRLSLNKLVSDKKTERKTAIVNKALNEIDEYMASINKEFNARYIDLVPANFTAVIKGKKTLDSVQSAINDELAKAKIEVNEQAQKIRLNIKTLNDQAADYRFLFNDLQYVIQKSPDDFALLVQSRIDAHKQAEAEKAEREEQQRKLAEQQAQEKQAEAPAQKTEPTPINKPATQKQPGMSDATILKLYADSVQAEIHNLPNINDPKLKKLALRIQTKLLKAVDEIYTKLEPAKKEAG